jgi:hypothetical protein
MLNNLLSGRRWALWRWMRARRDLPGTSDRPSRPHTLILFATSMWDQPLDVGDAPLPDDCEITTDLRRFRDAAAVVFHIPTLHRPPTRAKARGQLWVAWSIECAANYPQLRDACFMRQFDLTMTYRLDADVPIPYTSYYGDVANLARALRSRPRPKTRDKMAALFISGRLDRSGRVVYAAELMRHLDIHSYGSVLRNRELEVDHGRPTKLKIIANYKFTLAFENAVDVDYVTEKFFDPLVAGSIPVYLGAPNVGAFAPGDHCFINTADFPHPRDLAAYLLNLQRDDAQYEAYFAWKERPFHPAFLTLLAGQEEHPVVRLCRAVRGRQGAQP